LTFDLEKRIKVTALQLPKGTLWVKYEPDWAKEREDMLWTRELDALTDRMTTIGCPPSGALKLKLITSS
jgi:hypothetical protein